MPDIKNLTQHLPEKLEQEILRYKFEKNQYEHAIGKFLLLKALTKYGYDNNCLEHLKYNSFSRPYINNEVDFNISHSSKYVICCISTNRKVGVDIEKIREIDFDSFKNIMNQSQWKEIIETSDPKITFFKYWTIKESVSKAIGMGLSLPFGNIELNGELATYNSQTYYTKELNINKNYFAHIASDKQIVNIGYHEIFF